MTWLQRYRLRDFSRRSLWLAPTVCLGLALLVAPGVRWLDRSYNWTLFGFTTDGARALLSAIAPATLMLIGLVLTTLLLAVQLASSQMSPRLIASSMARLSVKVCLSVFVVSYVYCSSVLGRIEDHVPQLGVTVAVLLTLLSISAGLYLIDFLAKELRPVRVLERTAQLGDVVIREMYPQRYEESPAAPREVPLPDPPGKLFCLDEPGGVLLAMHPAGLVEIARSADCVIEILPQVGDFVSADNPLFRIYPEDAASRCDPQLVRESLAFGHERTMQQDPAFVFRILVDIAAKALSPAINDPTTAVLAIDQIHHLLRQVGLRRLNSGEAFDAAGQLRLVYSTPNWEDFVLLAIVEIRQYGSTSIQVTRRLSAMLQNLREILPEHRIPALDEQLRLLNEGITRGFLIPQDQEYARAGDYQGLGSPRSHGSSTAPRHVGPKPHTAPADGSLRFG